MDIYTDYANWKFENSDLIGTLVKSKSSTISRFTSVIAVVDYLYDKFVKEQKLSEDEEVFFSTGFDYIYDQFHIINTLLEYKFDKDVTKMEQMAITINLLLYINEFQAEVLEHKDALKNADLKKLDKLEDMVNECIDKKENAPEEYFGMLDDITNEIFENNGIEINTMESIFYEIAVEYGIFNENDFDVYNQVLNNQIEKNRKK